MDEARQLPGYLVERYRGWKATKFRENESWFRHLAQQGQHPRAMVITCCDSRMHITSVFGADPGEFFLHRNIANLVPPHVTDGENHGTSAAVEFAVVKLRVPHVIVVGHSSCGGIADCEAMCSGHAPELEEKTSFVGRWMDILRPGFERVRNVADRAERVRALEKQAVLVSLENLMTFPFVTGAVRDGTLTLHGLWLDIGAGVVEQYDAAAGAFRPL